MKDFIANHASPGSGVALLKGAERGVSNLICLPQTAQEIQEKMIRDEAARTTMDTRTYDEAMKLAKLATIKPPAGYYAFRNMLKTTAALVFALYGVHSPLYRDLLSMVNILKSKEVKRSNLKGFVPGWCAMASWAIYKECIALFNQWPST
jgi:hypothetical protein